MVSFFFLAAFATSIRLNEFLVRLVWFGKLIGERGMMEWNFEAVLLWDVLRVVGQASCTAALHCFD